MNIYSKILSRIWELEYLGLRPWGSLNSIWIHKNYKITQRRKPNSKIPVILDKKKLAKLKSLIEHIIYDYLRLIFDNSRLRKQNNFIFHYSLFNSEGFSQAFLHSVIQRKKWGTFKSQCWDLEENQENISKRFSFLRNGCALKILIWKQAFISIFQSQALRHKPF